MALFKFDGFVYTDKFDPQFPGYIRERKYVPLHVYVYWRHTGLLPKKGESVIHHKDGNRNNNEFENLELITLSKHASIHYDYPHKFFTSKTCAKISLNNIKTGMFGFKGCDYHNRNNKPWNKVWRCRIRFNKYQTNLGLFHDPLSCEIVYKIVQKEIYGLVA